MFTKVWICAEVEEEKNVFSQVDLCMCSEKAHDPLAQSGKMSEAQPGVKFLLNYPCFLQDYLPIYAARTYCILKTKGTLHIKNKTHFVFLEYISTGCQHCLLLQNCETSDAVRISSTKLVWIIHPTFVLGPFFFLL